jgi:hypothetical protein
MFSHNAAAGRSNHLAVVLLAVKWSLFGRWVVGWQLAAFAQMSAFAVLLYLLVRRWGATVAGSACAVTLVLCSLGAAQAWVRLSVSDAVAAAFLLAAMLAVSGLHHSGHWRRAIVGATILVAAMALTKEVSVLAVPAVWFSAACARVDRGLGFPRLSRRVFLLVAATAVVCFLLMIPTALLATGSLPIATARRYGSGSISLARLLENYAAIMVPFVPADVPLHLAVVLADAILLVVLVLGWRLAFSVRGPRGGVAMPFLFGLGFPLLGAAAFVPWPTFNWFYGLPYLVGVGVIVAFAISGIQRAAPRLAPWAIVGWGWVSLYMATDAQRYAGATESAIRSVVDVTRALERSSAGDSGVIAVCGLPPGAWTGLAGTISAYARSDRRPVPALQDVSCDEARRRLDGRRVMVVVFAPRTGWVPEPKETISHRASRFDWSRLDVAHDTIEAAITPIVSGPRANADGNR